MVDRHQVTFSHPRKRIFNRPWSSGWAMTPMAFVLVAVELSLVAVFTAIYLDLNVTITPITIALSLAVGVGRMFDIPLGKSGSMSFEVAFSTTAFVLLAPLPEQLTYYVIVSSALAIVTPATSWSASLTNMVQYSLEAVVSGLVAMILLNAQFEISVVITLVYIVSIVVNLLISAVFSAATRTEMYLVDLFVRDRDNLRASFLMQCLVELAFAQIAIAIVMASPFTLLWFFVPICMLRFFNRQHVRLQEAERSSRTDMLTGLRNRRGFESDAREFIATRRAEPECVGMALFDLDHFKALNDTLGHATGDIALKRFALVLDCFEKMSCDDSWIVARVGGEEFAALFMCSNHGAVLESIRQDTEDELKEFGVTVSTGWTLLESLPTESRAISNEEALLEMLMESADKALYKAKNTGRNRIQRSNHTSSLRRAA